MLVDLDALLQQHNYVAGVDEAGRGPLAGPVFAAAVILDPKQPIAELMDSKKLSAKKRDDLALQIKEHALAWCIASASTEEIDTLNILQATMLAMRRACAQLALKPELILIDGNRVPTELTAPARAVIKGDDLVPAISAASILAKTARDAACMVMHEQYPHYGFEQHKGYGTKLHKERLLQYGPCPEHRRSFAPVRDLLKVN
ncbi:ribonuclease HII [Paenalcaligenes hominis]|uniref:ribonuclease HII n=1 Tax=Paenalcaligenes hominis TaxID=643674 RepID=UPI003523FFD3